VTTESKEIIKDADIETALKREGFTGYCVGKGRLMLLELLAKAGAGHYSSHTEEKFLAGFKLTNASGVANKKGRRFICSMLYASSNQQAEYVTLANNFRKAA
jgi:hypothetical protein